MTTRGPTRTTSVARPPSPRRAVWIHAAASPRPARPTRWAILLAAAAGLASGCIETRETVAFRPGLSGIAEAADEAEARANADAADPGGADVTESGALPLPDGAGETVVRTTGAPSTRAGRIRTAIKPLGSVPYDDFALPLLRPAGTYLATQVGTTPAWPTMLARDDGPLPTGTRVAVYMVDERLERPRLVAELPGGTLLGRSADDVSFLVERPRMEGGRAIGRVDWGSSDVDWVVDDDFVNAFAVQGPGDLLAWSRRPVGGEQFELVVRRDGEEYVLSGGDGSSWIMPSFAGGDVTALRLRDGILELCAIPLGPDGLDDSAIRRRMLTNRATLSTGYQTMAPVQGGTGGRALARPSVFLFHPARGTMAVWQPDGDRLLVLPGQAFGAAPIDATRVVAAYDDGPAVVDLSILERSPSILGGTFVPRATTLDPWSCILLAPDDGRVVMSGVRVLNADSGQAGAGGSG